MHTLTASYISHLTGTHEPLTYSELRLNQTCCNVIHFPMESFIILTLKNYNGNV